MFYYSSTFGFVNSQRKKKAVVHKCIDTFISRVNYVLTPF